MSNESHLTGFTKHPLRHSLAFGFRFHRKVNEWASKNYSRVPMHRPLGDTINSGCSAKIETPAYNQLFIWENKTKKISPIAAALRTSFGASYPTKSQNKWEHTICKMKIDYVIPSKQIFRCRYLHTSIFNHKNQL